MLAILRQIAHRRAAGGAAAGYRPRRARGGVWLKAMRQGEPVGPGILMGDTRSRPDERPAAPTRLSRHYFADTAPPAALQYQPAAVLAMK